MTGCTEVLPDGYSLLTRVDIKDKKTLLIMNVIALIIFFAFGALGLVFVPFGTMYYDIGMGAWFIWLKIVIMVAGMAAYILLHELVHGIVMKYYGAEHVKYGFVGYAAYAGYDGYFRKRPYLVIAMAPIVFWGVVLALLCAVVPVSWFWIVYCIQLVNLSGAAGDLYVTYKFKGLPSDILVRDTGMLMEVYAPGGAQGVSDADLRSGAGVCAGPASASESDDR